MMALVLVLLLVVPVQKDSAVHNERPPVDKAWSVLKSGLSDSHADKRSKAVHALQIMKRHSQAETMAEHALSDPATDVRAEAAAVLGNLGSRRAIPKLRAALKDRELKVVLSATQALYNLHDPSAYGVYYAILTGEEKGTEGLIQTQLDMLKNPHQMEKLAFETGIGFVPFGGMSYEAWKTITHDDSSPVKAEAATRLAKDPDPKSAKALVDALYGQKWQIRAAAVGALAERGDPAFAAALGPILEDDSDSVRYDAAAAIIELSTIRHRAHQG